MATYILTSSEFTGHVTFEFDDANGLLLRYDITEAYLTEKQQIFILQKLPRHLQKVKAVLGKSKTAKLSLQATTGATFQMFWDKYNDKGTSSKKKSEQKWNRMSQAQRDRAYNYIPTYFRTIPSGIGKKYAETYLNHELWNN